MIFFYLTENFWWTLGIMFEPIFAINFFTKSKKKNKLRNIHFDFLRSANTYMKRKTIYSFN